MLKAKAVRLFGNLFAAAGSLAVLYSAALFASRKGLLPQLPWLDPRAWLPADERGGVTFASAMSSPAASPT